MRQRAAPASDQYQIVAVDQRRRIDVRAPIDGVVHQSTVFTVGGVTGVVLANGTYMQSDCCTTKSALLNPTTLTWTATGTGKLGTSNDEESWTRLWDGTILTVDCNNTANLFASEIYTPATGAWTAAANTVTKTCDLNPDGSGSRENGPQVLRYDGTVLAIGRGSHRPALGIEATGENQWLGGHGELVRTPEEVRPALERAFSAGVPALVNVLTDPTVVYPRKSNLA